MKEFYNKDDIMKLEKYGLIIQTNETIKRIRELEDENEILRNKLDTYVYLDKQQRLKIKELETQIELDNKLYKVLLEENLNNKRKINELLKKINKLQFDYDDLPKKICDEIKQKIHSECISYIPGYFNNDEVVEYVDMTYERMTKILSKIQAKYENVSRETIDEEKDSD